MYIILHSRICIPAKKDCNIIQNMYIKYIFDDIFKKKNMSIFRLFVCDLHCHLRFVHIHRLPQYNYNYVSTTFISNTDLFCSTERRRGQNHNKDIPQPLLWSFLSSISRSIFRTVNMLQKLVAYSKTSQPVFHNL